MSKNKLGKYVWLVDTIYRAGKITFEEINEKWKDEEMDYDENKKEVKELPLRTFHKWRIHIEEMFGLYIDNEGKGRYRYYIGNAKELTSGSIRSWLFNTFSVSNLLMNNLNLKDKILVEEVPEGQKFLPVIIKALKTNHVLIMTYQSYGRCEANTFEVVPYCLKVFKQRWYMVACSDKVRIYALDRIQDLETTDEIFTYPSDFKAKEFFEHCYGIIADKNYDVETVKLKVSAGQANYLRSLPLHQSQREIEQHEEYSIFTVRLRPTFDFQQEILSMGSDIEVLSPNWFREDTAERVKAMWNKYKTVVSTNRHD